MNAGEQDKLFDDLDTTHDPQYLLDNQESYGETHQVKLDHDYNQLRMFHF